MLLDEAIRHCEERAECKDACGMEHAQLAEWLKRLAELEIERNLLAEAVLYLKNAIETAKREEMSEPAWRALYIKPELYDTIKLARKVKWVE